MDTLNNRHGPKYTAMQVRIWAELVVSGLYTSLDDPPHNNSMFERAGTGGKAKPEKSNSVANVVAEAASAITSVLSASPVCSKASQPSSNSPAKLIESRSKLYKQLAELQNLKSVGVLNDSEYSTEKDTILDLLRQLSYKAM